MTLSERIGHHLRTNVIGYLALFVALTGVSYAATKVTSKQIAKDAVKSKHIKDGQVGTAEVADNGITGADIDEASLRNIPALLADGSVTTIKLADQAVTIPKLAFDPATQAELGALAAPGTINQAANPVDFSKLKSVPADFADGVDNTGAVPANNSLGAAEPPAADDQIVDGSIDTQDLTDGSIANADIATGAAIADTKLGTISTAGKVSDSALSSNVTLHNAGSAFSLGDGEDMDFLAARTGTASNIPFEFQLTNDTTTGTQRVMSIDNSSATGLTEALLRLNNADSDTAVGTGLDISTSAGGLTTAIEASNASIGTALDIGANDIQTSGATISSAELEKLDGAATRSVGIPITSFVNVTDDATLDFTASNGTSPDFGATGDRPFIEWDADTDAGAGDIADIDKVAGQFVVPADFGSNGRIRLLYREFSTGSVPERFVCDIASNDSAFGATDTASAAGVPAFIGANLDPVATYTAGNVMTLRCNVDDGSSGTTADDVVRLFAASFTYDAAH